MLLDFPQNKSNNMNFKYINHKYYSTPSTIKNPLFVNTKRGNCVKKIGISFAIHYNYLMGIEFGRRLVNEIERALTGKKIGGRPIAKNAPSKHQLQNLYIKKILSIRQIAKVLNCSKDIVYLALIRNKIPRRPNTRKSKLWKIGVRGIRHRIKLKGLRNAAIYYGVNHSTLLHHLRIREKLEKKEPKT